MQVTFNLRHDKIDKNGLMPIRAVISFRGVRIRRVVKNVKSSLNHWNKKTQRIKTPLKSEIYNYHIEYNKKIDEFENKAKTIFRYILLNNIVPTKEFILTKLEKEETINLTHDFFTSYEEFIKVNKTTKAPRTIKSYRSIFNFLQEFENETNYTITFESVNKLLFEKLQDYTFLIKKNKNSHFAVTIKILKVFMTWSFERDYHTNIGYKKFKAKEDKTEVIYLTRDELKRLYEHNFENERLNRVRDVYCFNCFTGLRISDTIALKYSDVKDDHILITTQKTKSIDLYIPLNKYSKLILDKYKGTIYEPLPVISDVKSNEYIKECCKIVEIDELITTTRYRGAKRIDKTVPKYKLITNHTARKTFITNSLIKGMNEQSVRKITDSKGKSFSRYVDVSNDVKQQEMNNVWNEI